jgi:hypothetical protein
MRYLIAIAVLLFAAVGSSKGQEQQLSSPVKKQYFQIFLDAPVQKVNSVNYYDDSGPIEFKLAPDGKAIYLLDYKGEGGVKAQVVNGDGNVEEVIRSQCKVHSLQEL